MTTQPQLPLNAYQRDVWAADSLRPDSPQFNCGLHDRFAGRLDLDVLRACVERALERNDAFHLRFDERDGRPCQWWEHQAPQVEVVDLRDAADPEAACAAWMRSALDDAFTARRGRLCQAALLRETDTVTHLFLRTHHIVLDGYALNEFSLQVSRDYAALTAGAPLDETPAPDYRDSVPEDARYRSSDRFDQDRAFFRSALDGVRPALFPRAAARPEQRPRGRHTFVVEGALVDRILAAGHSPYAYLTAAFGACLARLHRTDEVVLGVPMLNRRSAAELRTVGQYANTLPLRLTTRDGLTLPEMAAEVRRRTRDLRAHERLALGDVLRELPAGLADSRRLFDVTVSYLRFPRPAALPGVRRETTLISTLHEGEALSVVVRAFEDTSDIHVDLGYARDVFDEHLPITGLADQVLSLLRAGLDTPDLPSGRLPVLTDAQQRELLAWGTGRTTAFDQDATVHGRFEEQAHRTPDRTAVAACGAVPALSYAQLDRRANQVARRLRSLGVVPGDRVAVLLRRGPHLLTALLGVLKSGAAYVPVDPGYPGARIAFLLRDCGAKAVLVGDGREEPDGIPAGVGEDLPVLPVGTLLTGPDTALEPAASSRDLAYAIYTSGSTGTPKGVMVEHRSVINRLAWMQRRYPLGERDVILQKTQVSFDVSVWELFWWGVTGAAVALLPVGGEKDPRHIVRAIEECGVTTLHFVPSMLGPFLDLLESSPARRAATAAVLRQVFCSGEALPASRVEQFHRVFGADGPLLVNLYGPTEATVDVSYHDLPAIPGAPVTRVPIGRPVDNTRLYVLGPQDRLQPAGAAGELCIGGVQVARGYLGRPELTAEKYTDDPFVPGERLYRTGDLARWLADGTLEYLGRIDGQVKVRGNRIELGEVQSRLATAPGVRDALVVDRHSPARGTHLVGYCVADGELDDAALRAHLTEALPEFMVPSYFVRIDGIPLTPNGKADRRALPEPAAARGGDGTPADGTEAALAAVWSEVLGVHPVGVHDNYFALGGDSITMLRVRALAEEQGLHFSLSDLMQAPTVAGLAARTGTGPQDAVPAGPAGIEPFALLAEEDRARAAARGTDAFPLSRLQLGLIYHSLESESSAVYHDVFRYSFEMAWDEQAFRAAAGRLARRHPALRSSFDLSGFSEPLQIVHSGVSGLCEVTDLRDRDADSAAKEIAAHIEERRFHRYDFTAAPLCRFQLYVCSSSVELVLSFHHSLLDGGSVAALLGELLQDYAHHLGPRPGPVPETALPSLAHYARAERAARESEASRAYWTRLLESATVPRFEGFRSHLAPRETGQIVRHVDVPAEVEAAARRLAAEHGIPLKSLLFAAYRLTLGCQFGADDFACGLVTHGRPEVPGGDRIAGLFLNTMPVRLVHSGRSWLEVARQAFAQEQESHPHRRYPLSSVQEALGRPAVDAAFNYVHFHVLAPALQLPGIRLRSFRTWEETNFAILVNAIADPADGRVRLRVDYDGRTFSPEQADLFGAAFTGILRRMTEQPEEQVDFGFLADATAGTAAPSPASLPAARRTVVDLFEEQVRRTPGAQALAFDGGSWTYRELDAAANRVAGHLRGCGTGPGDRIAVAMDRAPETVAVVLGVAKAGAACVPLDTGYPEDRLRTMVEQSAPVRIVAHRAHAGLAPEGARTLLAEDVLADDPPAAGQGADAIDGADGGPRPAPEHIAYILFTSGSTGAPKGVAMPHRSLANLVTWQNGRPSGSAGGRTLQFAPLSFDVSFQEIYATLCSGGSLRIVTEDRRRDMAALLRLLDEEGVERVFLPYVALQQLAETSQALGLVPGRLRVLISSGEQLRVTPEIRRLCDALPGVLLENQYGPTESHVVTSFTMTGDSAAFPALPPIGKAIDGAEVLVLDDRMRPVPDGVQGEIHLGGSCLADGYLGRPDLTRERFVPHPDGTPAGSPDRVLYRSGDLGLRLPGGDVVCLGRADSQIKVRGYRVEPAEVELAVTALADRFPGIREAAVVARRREGIDSFLAAFLVGDGPAAGTVDGAVTGSAADPAAAPATADTAELRKLLRRSLPDHMVPSHFAWLPRLPKTPSGKRDDAALRALPLADGERAHRTPPRDAHERLLVTLLAELLRTPEVGVHDNFFDLGGTSLTAMRLIVLIEQRTGVNVPMSRFIMSPTAAELACFLRDGGARTAAFDPLVPFRTGGTRPPMFFVHPMGGNVLCYAPLVERLPEDQPFYALQAPGSDAGTEPLSSVGELAAHYLAAIRRVRPEGPYVLGGWSFGGFVAFEMARQLTAQGAEVAKTFLLDTVALPEGRRTRSTDDALLGWFFWELLWAKRDDDSPLTGPQDEAGSLDERFARIARRAVELGVLPAGSSGEIVRRLFRVYAGNWQAALDYRPGTPDLDITLLRAQEPLPAALTEMHESARTLYRDPGNGWSDRTRGHLEVVDVPGDHVSLMKEPHVATVARTLTELSQAALRG
ncbi:putative non-ribosomal peptide synthetase [Streptomyces sp. NBRC 110611]|uniref:non-ribosomal peptide synthetase n=1 Tax=Streptomyces sp. NBRC 110611 TaxID=1621259 RepID=UPI000830E2D3|nr:non-ribosomal peptide synthetase [Streptomyces sp. NBRC 110611]GAU69536.1 putative non-ribosomal peptide synthetase [Streptomyces sp. NBRC 110611]